jgi:hypothetical protein
MLVFFILVAGVEQNMRPPDGEPAPSHIPTVITSVEANVMESFPMRVTLQVTGYHPYSCELPVQVEQRREGNTIFVDIYREIPPNVRCGGEAVPYADDILLEGEFVNENYVVIVNGFAVDLNFGSDTPAGFFKAPHLVNSVEVGKYPSDVAYPSVLYLTVHSTIDGCEAPTQHTQRREGNTVYVELYRELSVSQTCPAIAIFVDDEIPLEGGFEAGTYTFIVNGVEVQYEN